MSDIDLFDLFNIEHQDNILDIFYNIKDIVIIITLILILIENMEIFSIYL